MFRKTLGVLISLGLVVSAAAAGDTDPSPANLSAAAIVDRNVAARGGLQAWRAVQTISFAGKLTAGGNQRGALPVPMTDRRAGQKSGRMVFPSRPSEEAQLPFVLDLKRSRKMRMELQFNGQTAIQVFDGANGWKLRPFLNRREVEPYTAEEMKSTSSQADLDGFLIDYAAKGTQIELVGREKVEDRDTYKLKLTMKSGEPINVWIDAQTFLEAKIQGQPRRLDGVYHPVEIHYRDYRPVNGLQVPYLIETEVLPLAQAKAAKAIKEPTIQTEKIFIEKVMVNPKLDDSLFSKPETGLSPKVK
jgi:outer membrane lipoprotein-sorting protein